MVSRPNITWKKDQTLHNKLSFEFPTFSRPIFWVNLFLGGPLTIGTQRMVTCMTASRRITISFWDSGSPNWSTDLCLISFHFIYCVYLLRQCVQKHLKKDRLALNASPQWKTCGSTLFVLDGLCDRPRPFSVSVELHFFGSGRVRCSYVVGKVCLLCSTLKESTTLILQLRMVGTKNNTNIDHCFYCLGRLLVKSVDGWTLIPDGKAKGMPLTLFIADRSETDGRWHMVQEFCILRG